MERSSSLGERGWDIAKSSMKIKCALQDSNLEPIDYEPIALTIELRAHRSSLDTILLFGNVVQLLQSGFDVLPVRKDVVRLCGAYVCMAKYNLNRFGVNSQFIQAAPKTATKGMPAVPCAIDFVGNNTAREIVQVQWPKQYISAKHPTFAGRWELLLVLRKYVLDVFDHRNFSSTSIGFRWSDVPFPDFALNLDEHPGFRFNDVGKVVRQL